MSHSIIHLMESTVEKQYQRNFRLVDRRTCSSIHIVFMLVLCVSVQIAAVKKVFKHKYELGKDYNLDSGVPKQ